MPKFKVGDTVTMSQFGGTKYVPGLNNPWGEPGTIVSVELWGEDDILPIEVRWGNGTRNYYDNRDLELLSLSLENK